jgi:hypothetical protein
MENKKMTALWLGLFVIIAVIAIGVFFVIQRKPYTSQKPGYVLYEPETPRTYSPSENVILDNVQLITTEDKVAQNTTADEISKLVMAAEQKVREIFAKNEKEFKLLIRFTIYPSESPKIELAYQGNADEKVLETLKNELASLEPIYTKTESVIFQAAFTVKAK